jgi:L-amino acid N-acyltransferase YncA
MVTIRPVHVGQDDEAVWQIFKAVVSTGDTYVFAPDISQEDALGYWLGPGIHPYVAEHDGAIVGTYVLKPNQPGLGSHVANASYMVAEKARGHGVGLAMANHSLPEAKRLGFLAIQFNAVVATNEPALRLWRKVGFETVGTVPKAFRHAGKGLVDIHVMHRFLDDI